MHFRFHSTDPDSKISIVPVCFDMIQYDEIHHVEHHFNNLVELNNYLERSSYKNSDYCTWLNVKGIHENDVLDELSKRFNIHSLIREDISTINERMKIDLLDNGSSIYLLMKMVYIDPHNENVEHRQISFLLQENNFLMTFEEVKVPSTSFDIFQVLKHRLRNNRGRIRSLKIDYLFYCLLDMLIENYMIVLDHIGLRIDIIDKLLINKLKEKNDKDHLDLEKLKLVYYLKHDMLCFRILCLPLREIILKLQKTQDRISMAMVSRDIQFRRQYRRRKRPKRISLSGNYFFNPNNDPMNRRWSLGNVPEKAPLFNEYIYMYFKDLNDHILHLRDRIDTFCDLLSSLSTFYTVLNDAERNKIMSLLTLISIIFIPLMFLNGLFSMNFDNTPPFHWNYSYYVFLTVLVTAATSMIAFFKWKRWF